MKDLKDALSDWRKAVEQIEKLNSRMPTIMGNEALKVIDKNFENESYDTGSGKEKWEQRSAKTNAQYDSRKGGLKGSVFNSANKILQQTGNLRDAVRKKVYNASVFIGVDLKRIPYAQAHNEGNEYLPQRQYMPIEGEPENPAIMIAVLKKIKFEHEKIMRIFKL